ncbi:MAG: protein-methionine-sulfoxide reductase catalytic subunit MsrP [Planctomycetota bacterium]|jgi:sulfoxide reductase catalytic subunit YedY
MPHIRIPPPWRLPDAAATPEAVYVNRRRFIAAAAGTLLLPSLGCAEERRGPLTGVPKYPTAVPRSEKYKLDRPLTKDTVATSFNNYYEFTTDKERVWKLSHTLKTRPCSIEIAGHCKRTGMIDLDDVLKKLPQEERLYRFRCVETWAMTVPWIGIPMRRFLAWLEPTSKAKYVRFWTVWLPEVMPGQSFRDSFPYYEALRMDEAQNELTMLVTGMFGRQLPTQNGAPVRVIVPWKYGYKSPKSIVRIEFVEKQPPTFWNDAQPREYGFYSNVNPKRAHPRWSQATEWMIPRKERRPTLLFNGYGEQVAKLYQGMDLIKNH